MQEQALRWNRFESSEALRASACDAIIRAANAAIAGRGRFLIVLAGGSTPKGVYRMLREAATDWSKWHVYFGDERCLPAGHPDRNSTMAEDALLAHVPVPRGQVHRIPAELGGGAAADAYCATLQGLEDFDLVLLGLGEDGHTASLFPGHDWEHQPPRPAIAVSNAPKPPSDRVSIAASRLSRARAVLFLVEGAGKQHAVAQWKRGESLPVSAILPAGGVDVYLDAAAG
ncbi:MAG: 6-phosphogluconolactonase [Methylobacterium sp.]|nr:6-phosphogluconolactonase [Methylobacterium sp.]